MATPRSDSRSTFLDLPDVQQQLEAAQRWYAQQRTKHLAEEIGGDLDNYPVESPIEAMFALWWVAVARSQPEYEAFTDLTLSRQHEVELSGAKYRIDFIVTPDDADLVFDGQKHRIYYPGIAVELDGHDFHERTKEQVELGNRRDRAMQKHNWTVFHFSGTELLRNPARSVEEVFKHAQV